jgi:membrane protein implicated in regulation of membrane protease activity
MSYAVEWIWGVVVFAIALVLVFVPWFAAIAVVVATIAVLGALVALLAFAAAALASPYMLVRNVRRRLARRRTRRIHSTSGIRSRPAAGSPAGLGRPHLTALANDEPDDTGAILEDVTRRAA